MSGDQATSPVPACRLVRLAVSYASEPAIRDIDLCVDRGEVIALLGPSGSGKSTLLHAVAGIVPVTSGEIWLYGERVASAHKSTPPERRRVGLVFQDFALWPHLNALETVAYPMRRAGRSARTARLAAQALLDRLEVGNIAARSPNEMSGGQRQRVGLARALAREPGLFLLDEPTAHLDTQVRAAFQECVREQQAATGAAALYATHDAAEALALADRVALIVDGSLLQVGTPEVVYARPVDVRAAALTGAWSMLIAQVASLPDDRLSLDFGEGAVVVDGRGAAGRTPRPAQVLLRPEWVAFDGPFAGRVCGARFRGPHTDYHLDTAAGSIQVQRAGPPRHGPGEAITWGLQRAWVLPAGEATSRP